MDDKKRLMLIGINAVLVVSGFLLYSVTVFRNGQLVPGAIAFIIAIVGLIVAIFILKGQYADLRKGMPLQDERSQKVMLLAFARSFVLSIWWLLILSWLSDKEIIKFRDVSQAMGLGILGMTILVALCWFWYSTRQDVELEKWR
jgi:uncharacterized membrane protein